MDEYKISKAQVIKGDLFEFLQGIVLFGRVSKEGNKFYIFGCSKPDERKFYKGILEYNKKTKVIGLKTVEEVEEFWLSGCDGLFLYLKDKDYALIK